MAVQNHWSREDIIPDGRLPGDLMVSILTNLPVKSLLKFKAVSKSWCSLISSRPFIKMHLRRQSVIAKSNNLLLSSCYNHRHQSVIGNKLLYKFGIPSDTNNNDFLNWKIPPLLSYVDTNNNDFLNWKIPPLLSYIADDLQIFAVCSGLVCLRPTLSLPEFQGLILWNPATRKFLSLNSPPFKNMGICYVEATDDYKIVVWSDTHTSVYSLSSESWKKLDNDAKLFPIGRYQNKNPAFFYGRMHWLVHTCTCCNARDSCVNETISIVAFDVADEVVSCLGIPDNSSFFSEILYHIQTLVIKGCLSVVIFFWTYFTITEMEIWVMEEYGVEGSWVKQFLTIQELPLPIPKASFISWNDCEIVFTTDNYEEYIEYDDIRERIMFYDPFSKKKYYLEFECLSNLEVFNYVENLSSVGTEEEIATLELVEV